jgi:hypothetical protein
MCCIIMCTVHIYTIWHLKYPILEYAQNNPLPADPFIPPPPHSRYLFFQVLSVHNKLVPCERPAVPSVLPFVTRCLKVCSYFWPFFINLVFALKVNCCLCHEIYHHSWFFLYREWQICGWGIKRNPNNMENLKIFCP